MSELTQEQIKTVYRSAIDPNAWDSGAWTGGRL